MSSVSFKSVSIPHRGIKISLKIVQFVTFYTVMYAIIVRMDNENAFREVSTFNRFNIEFVWRGTSYHLQSHS